MRDSCKALEHELFPLFSILLCDYVKRVVLFVCLMLPYFTRMQNIADADLFRVFVRQIMSLMLERVSIVLRLK